MQLEAFKVRHFRSLYSTDWIHIFDLTLFTGENDGGKSSTLYALRLFFDPQQQPAEDDFSYCDPDETAGQRHDCIEMWARLRLNEADRQILQHSPDLQGDTITIRRCFTQAKDPAPFLLTAQGHADSRFHKDLASYTVTNLRSLAEEFDIPLPRPANKPELLNAVREWLVLQPQQPVELELPAEIQRRLPRVEIFSSETAANPDDEIKRALTIQFRSLLTRPEFSGKIGEVTALIEKELNLEVEKLQPMVQRYCPDVRQVTARPSFNFANGLSATHMQLHRGHGGPVALERSGAGQKRRISLAVYEWQLSMLQERAEDAEPLIMAFDEPDTHLDYNSQRQVFDLIKRFADLPAVQVIVATHSLNMLERVPLSRIVHYSLGDQRRTQCMHFDAASEGDHELIDLFMYRISENLGLRNSIMLHERCFLVVEGATEMAALPVLFHLKYKMPMQSAGICLINGDNNYGVRQFTRFLHKHKRPVLFLVDSDCKTESSLGRSFTSKNLQDDGIDEMTQVHYVGTAEFEDAFSDEQWARLALLNYPKHDGTPWEPGEFAALRAGKKFSKSVQDLIRSVYSYSPGKPELGFHMAQLIQDAAEIPAQIDHCFECAYAIANPASR